MPFPTKGVETYYRSQLHVLFLGKLLATAFIGTVVHCYQNTSFKLQLFYVSRQFNFEGCPELLCPLGGACSRSLGA
eukprot:6487028-Amphidinium_carterae.1